MGGKYGTHPIAGLVRRRQALLRRIDFFVNLRGVLDLVTARSRQGPPGAARSRQEPPATGGCEYF